jgi:hypothetical protein
MMLVGMVSTFAGTGESSGFTDGTATIAKFSHPISVALDSNGVCYVSDYGNSAIRIVMTTGGHLFLALISY